LADNRRIRADERKAARQARRTAYDEDVKAAQADGTQP
jgi:hypothetical protein